MTNTDYPTHTVTAYVDGKQDYGIRRGQNQRLELVAQMPGLDGVAVLDVIDEARPARPYIKGVVFVWLVRRANAIATLTTADAEALGIEVQAR